MLAPLALLLVLEARCVHFAFVLIIVCCGVVHRCSHQHILYVLHDDQLVTRYKDASEHNRDCNGNSSAHVQGRRQVIRSI